MPDAMSLLQCPCSVHGGDAIAVQRGKISLNPLLTTTGMNAS